MMEMDTRLWCGACSPRAAIGNETREMNETQVTRVSGPDVVTWSSRQAASGQVDAARPAPVPRELVAAETGAAGTPVETDGRARTSDSGSDATFPTSYARFSIDAKTQKLSIKIVDALTDEVIREIPPEQVQRIAEDLQSLARRGSVGKRPAGADTARNVAGGGVDRYV